MKARQFVLMGVLVVGLTVSCSSQDNSDPVAVVRTWTEALKATDFQKMSTVMHPEALTQFKDILMPVMQGFNESIAQDTTGTAQVPDSLKQMLAGIDTLQGEAFYTQSMRVLSSIVPDLRQSLSGMSSTIIGGVPEGDTLVHVVQRTSMEYMGRGMTNEVDVVTVKKSDGGWRVMLTGGMRGLAEGMRQAFMGRG